jgi:hypothetical protein
MHIKPIPVANLGQPSTNAPLPKPDGALYRHPNPDGTAKRCGNCALFIAGHDRCSIHLPDQVVEETQWCGYFIFGNPSDKPAFQNGILAVTPDISGLREVGFGAACGSCRYYRDQGGGKGFCIGVSKPDDRQPPVPVETLGICARYEAM